jgi:thioredoxin reductase (NADPH)
MTDILIIGGGPAGLSAAIYAKRAGFSVTVIDKGAADCQLAKAADVENYLGFPSINGLDLHTQFIEHVKKMGIPIIRKAVVSVEKTDIGFKVHTKKDELECKHLILAMGRSHRHLGVEGEDRFACAGVSYCATCDGFFFAGAIASTSADMTNSSKSFRSRSNSCSSILRSEREILLSQAFVNAPWHR